MKGLKKLSFRLIHMRLRFSLSTPQDKTKLSVTALANGEVLGCADQQREAVVLRDGAAEMERGGAGAWVLAQGQSQRSRRRLHRHGWRRQKTLASA